MVIDKPKPSSLLLRWRRLELASLLVALVGVACVGHRGLLVPLLLRRLLVLLELLVQMLRLGMLQILSGYLP